MKGGIMYSQRDIVLIPFPYTDLTASKLRPAVIISNNELNDYGDFICCLVTRLTIKPALVTRCWLSGDQSQERYISLSPCGL